MTLVDRIKYLYRFISATSFKNTHFDEIAELYTVTQNTDGSIKVIENGDSDDLTIATYDAVKPVTPTATKETIVKALLQIAIQNIGASSVTFGAGRSQSLTLCFIGVTFTDSDIEFYVKESAAKLDSKTGLTGWDITVPNIYEITASITRSGTTECIEASLKVNGKVVAIIGPIKTGGTYGFSDTPGNNVIIKIPKSSTTTYVDIYRILLTKK